MAICVEQDRPPEQGDVESILRFLRVYGDDYHQLKEESALFPELMRNCISKEAALRQMLFEHDQERSLVAALEDALYTRKGKEFVLFATRFVALIRNHILKEDYILFDIVERSLSAEQDEKIISEFGKFKVDPAQLDELRRLEWKYLRRAA